MLEYLHNEIAKIIEIEGVSENFDETIDVQYKEQPDEIQLEKINQLIQSLPLEKIKKEKLKQLDSDWVILEQTGWDSGQGYHLGITPSDVALIVGVFSLAREASAMGMPLPKLISMENNSIEFETIQDMTVLLMYYGNARSDMAKNFAQKRKAVEAATTIEEVNAIS